MNPEIPPRQRERLPLTAYPWERDRFTECLQWRRRQQALACEPANDELAAAYLLNEVWGDQ
jgi:hypothetical protein